jgi:uncharacterized protein (DUF1015 family)
MVTVRAFKGVRPRKELAEKVASFPYDVINSKEAREIAKDNPYSFLHVVKPEIDLPEDINLYDEKVYQKAKENFYKMIENKVLIQDDKPYLYIYAQQMGNHIQYGIVGCTSADDYNNDKIKKHEFTRKVKEDDRTKHVMTLNANAGPVFLTYRDNNRINEIVENFVKNNSPEYDFTKEDGIRHIVWIIKNEDTIKEVSDIFKTIEYLYVADGHHRSASAARVKAERMKEDPDYNEEKEYNFFESVIFPASQLKIMDYNRVVFDLNGLSEKEFLQKVEEKFEIIATGKEKPQNEKEFGMYLNGKWRTLKAKEGTYPAEDPVESLDVAVLQNNLLSPILGIGDPRTDNRIDFVGGIRGTKELEKRVNSGECAVAFSLYPTSVEQLMSVADAGKVMPPKSTWFEPKLRSGLIVHLLD